MSLRSKAAGRRPCRRRRPRHRRVIAVIIIIISVIIVVTIFIIIIIIAIEMIIIRMPRHRDPSPPQYGGCRRASPPSSRPSNRLSPHPPPA
jgi:hypothetical protein